MQEREPKSAWGNMFLFVVVSCLWVLGLSLWLSPPPRQPPPGGPQAGQEQTEEADPSDEGGDQAQPKETKAELTTFPPEFASEEPTAKSPEGPDADEVPELDLPASEPKLFTLGSLDPASPYRGMATVTNLGAAAVRFELNSPRFGDLEDRSGYLGHLALDEIGHLAPAEMARRNGLGGCLVDVVGPGTPAALAGLKPGDLITSVNRQKVADFRAFALALQKTEPGQTVELTVLRSGKPVQLSATLKRRPLEVVRPENGDPLSFLLTLSQVDDRLLDERLKEHQKENEDGEKEDEKKSKYADKERDETIGLELPGLDLRTGAWEVEDEAKFDGPGPHDSVTFYRELPKLGLKITKTFRLAQVSDAEKEEDTPNGYHLILDIKLENTGEEIRQVAYQLDGPTGLPVEGKWYAYKVGRGGGLRDVVKYTAQGGLSAAPCQKIANDKWEEIWRGEPVTYLGVDAQYFAAVMIPQKEDPNEMWFAESIPIRVGGVDKDWKKATNTSCRLVSNVHNLRSGETLAHEYEIFAGPKKPELLAKYGLKDVVYYGWFWWVAVPMLTVLHFFYGLVGNYGVAIIMLTVLVRGCMFPLSIRQTRGAQKMQELQPEIKKLAEKYKNNPEAKVRAQQELFRKHKYNPLSGCLIIFLQFPIFIGLYRGLAVDVELRQAPLISESIRWCSNLASPDMLFPWHGFMPAFVADTPSSGLLAILFLGPYFNLLPVLTITLFILQQKMFMPPATDDQQRTQQKMMKFMMVFMGLIFFKVASGLCLYFIATSLWGLAERKLLPKTSRAGSGGGSSPAKPKPPPPKPAPPQAAPPKPAQPETPLSKVLRSGSDNDGAARSKKKKKKKRSRGRR